MAKATDAAPGVGAYFQDLTFHQAAVGLWHLGHHLAVIKNPFIDLLLILWIVPAIGRKELLRANAAKVRGAMCRQGGRLVFGGAHEQGRVEFLAQPVRQAHVVGMHVRHQHPQNGQALHGARKHLLPSGLCARVGDAAIYGGPAFANAGSGFFGIFKQPQIDVVQGKWQLHTKPQNAGRNFEGLAQGGQGLAQGKAQRFFARQGRGLWRRRGCGRG